MNEEIRKSNKNGTGVLPEIEKNLSEVERHIANIRKSIEEGLADINWTNQRLMELASEREKLEARRAEISNIEVQPELDVEAVKDHLGRLHDVMGARE